MAKESTGEKGIGWAMHRLQAGGKARRPGWHHTAYLTITGKPGSSRPMIALHGQGDVVEYQPDQVDLLARDWEPVE